MKNNRSGSFLLMATLVMALAATAVSAQGPGTAAFQEKMKEHRQNVIAMRQSVMEFFAAQDSGDQARATAAAERAQALWSKLPPRWQKAIEERHPGTGERVLGLKNELGLPHPMPAVPPGGSVTHVGERTLPNGKIESVDATWTRNGNTVTKDATYTGPNGKTTDQDVTWSKNGNTVTRDGETTLPNGKTITSDGTWTKNGNTVTHQGEATTSSGKTATSEGTWTRNGNTVTHQGEQTGFNGKTTTEQGTWTRQGGGKGWKPAYKDDMDIFGGRPHGGRRA